MEGGQLSVLRPPELGKGTESMYDMYEESKEAIQAGHEKELLNSEHHFFFFKK